MLFHNYYTFMHPAQFTERKNEWMITTAQLRKPCLGQGMEDASFNGGQDHRKTSHVIRQHISSFFSNKKGSWAEPNTWHMLGDFIWYLTSSPISLWVGFVPPNCINKETKLYRVYVTCQSHTSRKWQSGDWLQLCLGLKSPSVQPPRFYYEVFSC